LLRNKKGGDETLIFKTSTSVNCRPHSATNEMMNVTLESKYVEQKVPPIRLT
jgi:hypothetical protein